MKFNFLKKFFIVSLIALMLAAFTGCGEQQKAMEQKEFKMVTGDISGTYYPIGVAIAEVINKEIPNFNISVDSSKGSIDNIKRIKEGLADFAIIQNDIAYYALNGAEMFRNDKVESLRAIASLYPETCQFVTLADKKIKSISELRGKKVAVGSEGSGAEANARQILEAYGLTYEDIDAQYLSFSDGSEALKNGKVEAAFLNAGFPTKAVENIASTNKIQILPIDKERSTILTNLYPYYTKTTIPSGTYSGQNEAVDTVSVMAIFVTSNKIDDSTGYNIAKAIFSNTDKLESAHSVGKLITKSNANKGISIKSNAGAEKYFKEN